MLPHAAQTEENAVRHAFTRRSFIGAGAMALGTLGLCACGSGSSGQTSGTTQSWSAVQDDSLDCLTVQVSGGNVVAMPGDGWAPRDGYIQLQLSGGSIPGQTIDAIWREGSVLNIRLGSGDQPSTLDLMLTEYRLEAEQTEVDAVDAVKVDFGNGDVQEIQRSYE